ncbi:MAG: hypothetical protein AB7K24_06120 [Gemmataceae bacterium]
MNRWLRFGILMVCLLVPACVGSDKIADEEYGPETPLGRIRYDMFGRPRLQADPGLLETGMTDESRRQLDAP